MAFCFFGLCNNTVKFTSTLALILHLYIVRNCHKCIFKLSLAIFLYRSMIIVAWECMCVCADSPCDDLCELCVVRTICLISSSRDFMSGCLAAINSKTAKTFQFKDFPCCFNRVPSKCEVKVSYRFELTKSLLCIVALLVTRSND